MLQDARCFAAAAFLAAHVLHIFAVGSCCPRRLVLLNASGARGSPWCWGDTGARVGASREKILPAKIQPLPSPLRQPGLQSHRLHF